MSRASAATMAVALALLFTSAAADAQITRRAQQAAAGRAFRAAAEAHTETGQGWQHYRDATRVRDTAWATEKVLGAIAISRWAR